MPRAGAMGGAGRCDEGRCQPNFWTFPTTYNNNRFHVWINMYPPSQHISLDITALSGLFGSISLACWIVVFSPQIVENFRRSSAEGLSTFFVIIWLTGDVFNVLGAVLQGVL